MYQKYSSAVLLVGLLSALVVAARMWRGLFGRGGGPSPGGGPAPPTPGDIEKPGTDVGGGVDKTTDDLDKAKDASEKAKAVAEQLAIILGKILKFETPAPTRAPFTLCNIYIVGNERQYIIDPGSAIVKAIVGLEKYIEENIDKIDGILLTNHMVDHCNQALSRLCRQGR